MMVLHWSRLDLSLPLENPVLKFLLILIIILVAPIVLKKLRIPHILGLIIAGAFVGPHGVNLLLRDSGIILSGTAGLLYIMFLAGLDINISDFKRNSGKSLYFGLSTFIIPMVLGTISSLYLLQLPMLSAILVASMYASHTLIAYPIVSGYGLGRHRVVNIAVGGTLITDTLALLVLAVIVGMTTGTVNSVFWLRLIASLLVFMAIVGWLFPLGARWFLKRYSDKSTQYIFVLSMMFMGAVLAEFAGIEAIIGAFLTGLSLNRLIPATSPLMNRIEFVGNTIFIPFFLIGVGMLVDYRVFFNDLDTIKVAVVMTVVATLAKFLAALFTQKSFRWSAPERSVLFGLSNAQAAATLAAVMVGYNIILGETADGTPIRLLSESILNGTIVMILITCTIASFAAQKGGRSLSLKASGEMVTSAIEKQERILIPVSNPQTAEELIQLGTLIRSRQNKQGFYALHVINNEMQEPSIEENANKLLDKTLMFAASTDVMMHRLLRYDTTIINGIAGVVKEHAISDLVIGLHTGQDVPSAIIGHLTEGLLSKSNVTTLIFKSVQPIATIKRHVVIVPPGGELVIGFRAWMTKLLNLKANSGSTLVFYASGDTLDVLSRVVRHQGAEAEFKELEDWSALEVIISGLKTDDNIILVLSRKGKPSYHPLMERVPEWLKSNVRPVNFILLYPKQIGVADDGMFDFKNPSLVEPITRLDQLRKRIREALKN